MHTEWEQNPTARASVNNSRRNAAVASHGISELPALFPWQALNGSPLCIRTNLGANWFIYQFLIELMFTHDCKQMINLLESLRRQIVRRSLKREIIIEFSAFVALVIKD